LNQSFPRQNRGAADLYSSIPAKAREFTMMKRLLFVLACGVMCLAMLSPALFGQDKGTSPRTLEELERLNQLGLARSLILHGQKAKEPAALLLAARILHPLEFRTEKPETLRQVEGKPVENHLWPTSKELVAKAEQMEGIDHVAGLLKDTKTIVNEKPRKRLPVGRAGDLSLIASLQFILEETMLGGEPANVAFDTHGSGSIRVEVLGPNFELIGKQEGSQIHITWVPPAISNYKIKITNLEERTVMASYIFD
jgi:hypothetical protein